MERNEEIYNLFFYDKKNIIEIANELGVSKQFVSKILKQKYNEEYEREKKDRSEINKKERNLRKSNQIKAKRGTLYEVDSFDLKNQHDVDVRCMSKGKKLSKSSAAFSCINAYDVKGDRLVYNERCGKRPFDLSPSIPLKLNIYK